LLPFLIRALKEIHTATHPARLERREEAERIEQTQPNRLLKRVYGKEALRSNGGLIDGENGGAKASGVSGQARERGA
jgi:hypothetical protein